MKKIIFLSLMIIFLTGCDAQYNIVINDGIVSEELIINGNDESRINQASNSFFSTDYRYENPESKNNSSNNENYLITKRSSPLGISFNTDFTLKEYEYSTVIFSGSEQTEYNYSEDKIHLNLPDAQSIFLNHPELDKMTIKISTNHEIFNHNADQVKEGNYYFHLNKSNSLNKNINFEISKVSVLESLNDLQNKEVKTLNSKTLIYIYSFIVTISVSAIIYIYVKVKTSNQ